MKRIVVSQRIDYLEDRNEKRDALDQRLVEFLIRANCLAFPIPSYFQNKQHLNQWLTVVQPDGMLLSGGNDLGDEPHRDQLERELLELAEHRRCPVLGICRGMQMMASHHGAILQPVKGHVRVHHELSGLIKGRANSYHTQKITACPNEYKVLAISEDGNIEAIGHQKLPFEAWMWHPEREPDFMQRDIDRARSIFACERS